MHLKRIEIAGFKSFPDPTEVIFGRGITAVVGPNGCGKSNLTDAVRWVLGEQRARVLRGGKMEEVIFGGTPQRQPLSASEVTLIIDNKSGGLACDYEEVSVTRRLDRAGNSEYRLNRTPCRLKDLMDLFLDTGMGSHAYSVIQQGMVDAIISENTDDVRYLFEEAAGVSKYKTRKRAAIRKLEATESDLVRLTDLKNEVATRTRSLARQKGKAEKFRELQDALKELRVIEAGRTYRALLARRGAIDSEFSTANDHLQGLQAQYDAIEIEWQKVRMASDDAERIATEAADRLAAATTAWHDNQTRLVQLRDRQTYLKNEQQSLHERRETLGNRRDDHVARLERSEQARTTAQDERRTVDEKARVAEQAYRDARDEHERESAVLQQLETEYQNARDERAQLDSENAATAERRDNWERQIEELSSRHARAESEFTEVAAECERLRKHVTELNNTLDEHRRTAQAAQETLARLESERTDLQGETRVWEERLHEWGAARDMLAGMIARGEGLGVAAETILTDHKRWGERVTGFGDRLRPHEGWELAVETALADRLGALLCRDADTAAEIMHFLSMESVGRAVVLDPSIAPNTPTDSPTVTAVGFTGWLSNRVDCDADVARWVDALLGRVAIAENAGAARTLFAELKGQYGVVSKDGIYLEPAGSVRLGHDTSGEPIVGRRDRLNEFEQKLRDGRDRQKAAQDRLTQLIGEIETARQSLDQQRAVLTESEATVARERLALEAANTRATEYQRTRDELAGDLEQRRTALMSQAADGDRRAADSHALLTRIEGLSQKLGALRVTVEGLDERLNAAGVALNDARVKSVETVARCNAAEVECQRLNESIREMESELEQIATRLESHQQETVAVAEELQRTDAQHGQLTTQKNELDDARRAARVTASQERELFSQTDVKVKDARRLRDEAERKRSHVEVDRSRVDAELDQYRRHAQESLSLDPAELPVDDSPKTDDEIKQLVADTVAKIEGIGPVNPLALEEYEMEKERWDFFEKQLGDLRTAKKELNETIAELNRTAGQRFIETFETARAHFQEVYTELFRGGEADVRLVNIEDPLESPIEIYARPRGKKFIGLRQLSGGERALTALALLFGLYLVKPSPFCILDEVDAPLDDANCGRFLRLIDRFKNRTQFIIVTHNKLTMESADALYGVTMEQSGVSKIVSVRLNRTGEEGVAPGLAEPRIELDANGMPYEVTEAKQEN